MRIIVVVSLVGWLVVWPSLARAQVEGSGARAEPIEAPEVPAPEPKREAPPTPARTAPVSPARPTPPTLASPSTPASPPVVARPSAAPPPPAPAPAAAPAPPPVPAPSPVAPLAGFSDGAAYLRSPDGTFVLFPSGRLQLDGYFFRSRNKTANNGFLLRRARVEVSGWIGGWVYFSIAGDYAVAPPSTTPAPVLQSNLATTDDFVAIAPWGNWIVLQVGQYDAPFTLENRTSDKYFDFMERSITVRALGIPENKQIGAMLVGSNDARNFLLSAGLFNGDGQNFRNIDGQFDGIARGWIAPFSFAGPESLRDVEIGGSFWMGDRENTLPLPSQTTQAGFPFLTFNPYNAIVGGKTVPVQLRQIGLLRAYAGEVNVPVAHKTGVRGELVWKHSTLSEEDVSQAPSPKAIVGGANLEGWSFYGEVWVWILGDDRIVGDQQGVQPFARWNRFAPSPIRDGLMLAFRVERLEETLAQEADARAAQLADSAVGTTKVTSFGVGLNYWHSRRYRATLNYVLNRFEGTTDQIQNMTSPTEQELLFRLAIAL